MLGLKAFYLFNWAQQIFVDSSKEARFSGEYKKESEPALSPGSL